MKKVIGFTKSMVAILLSSMLAVGTISGTVSASEVQENTVQEEEAVTNYTVILDANGGYFENEWDDVIGEYIESTEILNKTIPVGGTVTSFPVFKTNDQETQDMTFSGWSLERDGELVSQGAEEYIPLGDCVLYAVWDVIETMEIDNNEQSDKDNNEQSDKLEEEASTETLEFIDSDDRKNDENTNDENTEDVFDDINEEELNNQETDKGGEDDDQRKSDNVTVIDETENDIQQEVKNAVENSDEIVDESSVENSISTDAMYAGTNSVVVFNGHTYQRFDNSLSWTDSKAYCESIGGHLATITSSEEEACIESLCLSSRLNCWLGGTDEESEGNWRWITGETWSYTNWENGQPDNCQNGTHAQENYLQLSTDYHRKWNDACDIQDRAGSVIFICEWDNLRLTAELDYELADEGKNFVYTGKEITPSVDVFSNGKLLRDGSDYSIEYSNNVDVGKASVTITGKGEYLGNVITEYFLIIPPAPGRISLKNIENEAPRSMKVEWECLGNERFQYQFQVDIYQTENNQLSETQYLFGVQECIFKELKRDTEYYVEIHAELQREGELFVGEKTSSPKCISEKKLVPSDFWGVRNCTVKIDSPFFSRFFPAAKADTFGGAKYELCNAMSIAALASLSYSDLSNQIPSVESFGVEKLGDIEDWNKRNEENNMSLLDYIKYAKAYTKTRQSTAEWNDNMGNLQGLHDKIVDAEKEGDGVLITFDGFDLDWWEKFPASWKGRAHTVVGLEIVKEESAYSVIRIYDPTYPNDNERYLTLYRTNNVFSSFSCDSISKYVGLAGAKTPEKAYGRDVLTWRTINGKQFATLMSLANGATYDAWFLVNIYPIMDQWPSEWEKYIREQDETETDIEELYRKYVDFSTAHYMFSDRFPVDGSDSTGDSILAKNSFQLYCKLQSGTIDSVPGGTTLSFINDTTVYSISVLHKSNIYIKLKSDNISEISVQAEEKNAFIFECIDYSSGSILRKNILCTSDENCKTTLCIDEQNSTQITGADIISATIGNSPDRITELTLVSRDLTYNIDYDSEIPVLSEINSTSGEYVIKPWKEYNEYDDLTIIDSGSCGTHVTWTLYDNGILDISGSGKMEGWDSIQTPWRQYNSSIKKVRIGEGITYIGERAFYQCSEMTEVSIPDSVIGIGSSAFYSCKKLRSLDVPEKVETITSNMVSNCSDLSTVTLPAGVKYIQTRAFESCSSLKSLTMPGDSLRMIADQSFTGCYQLKDIYYNHSNADWYALNLGINDKNQFLNSKTTIHYSEIVDITGICGDNVTWCLDGDDVLTISGKGSMQDFGSTTGPWGFLPIKKVVIEDGVTNIGSWAFRGCIYLESVSLPDSMVKIRNSSFTDCTGLVSIELPDGVESIGSYAFRGCKRLQRIVIPSSVTEIDSNAFSSSALYSGPDNLTIYGEKDSYAERYAANNNITFVVLGQISIEKADVDNLVNKTYTGNVITQSFDVKVDGKTLTLGTDYTVSYSNNSDVGTATVTITGKGNYTGIKIVTFKILPVGWYEDGGEQYFYQEDGTKLTDGWAKNGTTWYWMDGNGKIAKNKWIQTGGKWYYMSLSGAMTTGWQQIGGKWYYMNSSGVKLTGWKKIGGKWYYMNSSGVMTTGWQKIGGKWYYMNSNGVMTTGWQKIGGKWYYMNSSGIMTTGWQKIGGKWYYMNSSGQMVTGTQVIGGKKYVFNSSGVWVK